MNLTGWERLRADAEWCRGQGSFPIAAYSEYMPPPWLGVKPYGTPTRACSRPRTTGAGASANMSGPIGCAPACATWPAAASRRWCASAAARPRAHLAAEAARQPLLAAGIGRPRRPAGARTPCPDLVVGPVAHPERQGASPVDAIRLQRTRAGAGLLARLLHGTRTRGAGRGHSCLLSPAARLGLRRFREGGERSRTRWPAASCRLEKMIAFRSGPRSPSPAGARSCSGVKGPASSAVRFLLTFRPFARLPAAVQEAYVRGELHLLPFPGSLLFWGTPAYRKLQRELPFAMQVPLLQLFSATTARRACACRRRGGFTTGRPMPPAGPSRRSATLPAHAPAGEDSPGPGPTGPVRRCRPHHPCPL